MAGHGRDGSIRVGVFAQKEKDQRGIAAALSEIRGVDFRLLDSRLAPIGEIEAVDVVLIGHAAADSKPKLLELIRGLAARWPELPIIVLSSLEEQRSSLEFIRAGALSYVSRKLSREELHDALVSTRNGFPVLSPAAARLLVEILHQARPSVLARRFKLTRRDLDIIELLQQARSNKEMSSELNLTQHTIREYLRRIYRKLGVHSRAQVLNKLLNF